MTVRVAVVADLLEERWPSMDLVANSLVAQLEQMEPESGIAATLLRPRLASRGPGLGRYINRFWDYPAWIRRHAESFDVYHIVDHSYAHLVHALPAAKTVVTCHDIDAFMPLLEPRVIRSRLPKVITRRVLSGMQKAAAIVCDSQATYDEVRQYQLVDHTKLSIAHVGIDDVFSPLPDLVADTAIAQLLGPKDDTVLELLHIGSTIPRKRLELLLHIVAAIKAVRPRVVLLKGGGALTEAQTALAKCLGVEGQIRQMPFLQAQELSALYRRAGAVVLTSSREGFGLPLAEAMACGTAVVASDLAVFREVGGQAVTYCASEDPADWRNVVLDVVSNREAHGRATAEALGGARARQFRWDQYAVSMVRAYRHLASKPMVIA